MLFLGQKYDHPRLQYFKLKLESSGHDSILRAEASFSWSALAYQAHRVQFPSSTRNGGGGSLPVFRETIVAGCLFLAAVQGRRKLFTFFPLSKIRVKVEDVRDSELSRTKARTSSRLVTRTYKIDDKVACKCPLFAGVRLHFLLGVGKVQANKIEDANHYILRTLTGHGKSLSYQELLNICKLDTLECRKKQQSLILLFKCIRNIGPKYIRDFFSIRETSYNLKGNGVNLCFPKFNLNFMKNSFT